MDKTHVKHNWKLISKTKLLSTIHCARCTCFCKIKKTWCSNYFCCLRKNTANRDFQLAREIVIWIVISAQSWVVVIRQPWKLQKCTLCRRLERWFCLEEFHFGIQRLLMIARIFFLFEWLVYCSQGIVRSSRSNGTITRLPKPTRNNTTIILTACTTTVHLGFITRTNLVLQRFAFDFRDFARFLRWLQVFSVWDWNKLLNSSDFKRTKCVNHRRQKKWSHVNLDVLLSVKRLWELRWNCKLQSMRDCATHHRSL